MDDYYEVSIENMMKSFYDSLSEKDRRRYAAVESSKLGHGGVTYVASVLLCDEKTIQRGMIDLGSQEEMQKESIRSQGGGRKSKLEKYDNINKVFLDVLRKNTAGDPMDEKVKWTNLSKGDIRDLMDKCGLKISRNIVRKLLKKNGIRLILVGY